MQINKQKLFELEKETYLKLPFFRVRDIRVLLARLYRDDPRLREDIELLLFYIYQDWNEVDEIIKKWKERINNM